MIRRKTHAEVRGVHLKRICESSDFSSAATYEAQSVNMFSHRERERKRARNSQSTIEEEARRTNVKEVVEQDLRLGGLEVDDPEGVLAV